jgi:hypothetical protein
VRSKKEGGFNNKVLKGLTVLFSKAGRILSSLEHFHQGLLKDEHAPSNSYSRQFSGPHQPIGTRSANAYEACSVLYGQRQCFVFMVFSCHVFCHVHTFTNEKALS